MLAIDLPKSIENRLFVVSQTIGISQNELAQKAIRQYLENLELVYQLKEQHTNTYVHTIQQVKSRANALSQYANPSLIDQEKLAWAQAILDKYGDVNHK
ncbi:hypothetical protein SKB0120_17130 [Moraxella osloensis]